MHPTAGTIFHKSSTGLHLWFYAMYLMTSTRCGISAKQLERELGVTYKTAHRIFKMIRTQLMTQDDDEPLDGGIEVDETHYGGKPRLSDKAQWKDVPTTAERRMASPKWADTKAPVFGMIEHGGEVRAYVVPSTQRPILYADISTSVKSASTVYTDDAKVYRRLPVHDFEHHRINYSENVYVSGDIHTQNIEGFWSQVT